MSRDEFEEKVIRFMARIDEHMENQNKRCDSHAADIRAVKADITDLQSSREHAKGVIKTLGIGVPAIGSAAWFIWQLVLDIKKMKGGG